MMGRDREAADYASEDAGKPMPTSNTPNNMIPDSLDVPQKSNSDEDD